MKKVGQNSQKKKEVEEEEEEEEKEEEEEENMKSNLSLALPDDLQVERMDEDTPRGGGSIAQWGLGQEVRTMETSASESTSATTSASASRSTSTNNISSLTKPTEKREKRMRKRKTFITLYDSVRAMNGAVRLLAKKYGMAEVVLVFQFLLFQLGMNQSERET